MMECSGPVSRNDDNSQPDAFEVRDGSFATEPAGPGCHLESACTKSDLIVARREMTRRATSRRPELSTRLKDHVGRRLGSAAKARKTRLSRDLAQSTLAGLGTESQCHLLR